MRREDELADELLGALRAAPRAAPSEALLRDTRVHALERLAAPRGLNGVLSRFLAPALLCAFSVLYLLWAAASTPLASLVS